MICSLVAVRGLVRLHTSFMAFSAITAKSSGYLQAGGAAQAAHQLAGLLGSAHSKDVPGGKEIVR